MPRAYPVVHSKFVNLTVPEKFIFVCAAPMAVAFLGKKVLDWSSRT